MASEALSIQEQVKVRPRFKLLTEAEIEDILELLKKGIEDEETVVGKVFWDYAHIKVPIPDRHYWSPELHVTVEKNDDGEGNQIRCMIGPRQSVWAMFVFMYAAVTLICLFGGMYGLVEWTEGGNTGWLWIFPASALIIGLLYIAARGGRKMGEEQTNHLTIFLYKALEEVDFRLDEE